jgi:hypothetical protein
VRWLCGDLMGTEMEHGKWSVREVVRWLCGDLMGTEVEHGKWSVRYGGGW